VIELHGNIFRARCVREQKVRIFRDPPQQIPPHCECGALLRPDIVWFGEMLPVGVFERAAELVRHSDLLLVIGTSGVVYPAAGLVPLQRGLSIEINPAASGVSSSCTFSINAAATAATPAIVEALLETSHA
jgi:NAD-dependent deacetylase